MTMPPPLLCLEWLQSLDQGYGCELLFKLQLSDQIAFEMEPERLAKLLRLWAEQPNLPPHLERLELLVASLT